MAATALPKTYATVLWLDDLDLQGRDTASDLASLEQDVLHVLMQLRGSNIADPDKGLGVQTYLNGTSIQLQRLPSLIDTQLSQMSRVSGSRTVLTQDSDGSFRIEITVAVGSQVVQLNYKVGPNGVTRA